MCLFNSNMGLGLVLGLLVICRSCMFLLLAAADLEDCPRSSSFPCNRLGSLHFPFTNTSNPSCGGLYVTGCDANDPASTVRLRFDNTTSLEIQSVQQSEGLTSTTMKVKDTVLQNFLSFLYTDRAGCRIEDLHNVTLPSPSPIMSFQNEVEETMTVYKCKDSSPPASVDQLKNRNRTSCDGFSVYYGLRKVDQLSSVFRGCTLFEIPAKSPNVAESEFNIRVTLSEDCHKCISEREGVCRLDDKGKFRCVFQAAALEQGHRHRFGKVLIVLIAASVDIVVKLIVLGYCFRRKIITFASEFIWKSENPCDKKIESFLKGHELHLTKRYTYSEIKEMTNSFKNKLGQGGFGSVYKGKLPDGRLVAVKLLNKLKGNGEEFINEVASISQTSHVNIVSLYGFCFQGSKRALVYEFMPNGSLEKFIYEDNATMVDRQLDCKTLYEIAIGTARGLEYLHRGCNTRILHFDIKPHNILLDVDFCPKISDFGLSKICPRKESIVSMLGARGTAGYIAPELILRNFGGVSHKSDVYSFGMMVLEMVGGRKNINVQVECSSEFFFPHWIYKCLEKNQELALRCVKNENDNENIRKMILVSLWCIQTDPSARPAMSKVVDMLEGRLESLQIPPKPFLSSPKSSPVRYSTSNLSDLSV